MTPTTIDFTFAIHKIIVHPARLVEDVGDTYRGIPIVRDPSMSLDEIHVVSGDRRIVMKTKREDAAE